VTKIIELSEALKALAAVQANGDTYVNYEMQEVIKRLMEEISKK